MPSTMYRRKSKAYEAYQYRDGKDLPQAVSCRIRAGYRLFDGTLVTQEVASARTYPLGQQPVQVDVYQTTSGTLMEMPADQWFVIDDDGTVTCFDNETFEKLFEPVPHGQ